MFSYLKQFLFNRRKAELMISIKNQLNLIQLAEYIYNLL